MLPSPPTVTSVSPNVGSDAGGTLVTITGTNFTGATAVTFSGFSGDLAATAVTVVNATSITAKTPSQIRGPVDVSVTTPSGTATLSHGYTYVFENTYVSAKDGFDLGFCPVYSPCATLNFALSVTPAGGSVSILDAGVYGPIVLNKAVSIVGSDPNGISQIVADTTKQVGCVGALPASCFLANNGYAVEIAAGAADVVKLSNIEMQMGSSGGIGALKLTSGGQTEITNDIFRGDSAATTPIILMAPNTSGIQSEVYFSNSDIGFNNANNANAGAVLVQPVGTNSLKLHFNHVEVHNASFGIRTDGSSLTNASSTVASFISESEFFSFPNAAVNAFSTSGTGTVNAVFDFTRILNAGVALKANGPQSFVILTNNTVGGNTIGVQQQNGATVLTSHNSTITGNGPSNNQNVSGTVTQAPRQ